VGRAGGVDRAGGVGRAGSVDGVDGVGRVDGVDGVGRVDGVDGVGRVGRVGRAVWTVRAGSDSNASSGLRGETARIEAGKASTGSARAVVVPNGRNNRLTAAPATTRTPAVATFPRLATEISLAIENLPASSLAR
jgi:hypothetical protein